MRNKIRDAKNIDVLLLKTTKVHTGRDTECQNGCDKEYCNASLMATIKNHTLNKCEGIFGKIAILLITIILTEEFIGLVMR